MNASTTAIIIGQPATCLRLERQLELSPARPVSLGWVVINDQAARTAQGSVLGALNELEAIVAIHRPDVALVSLPAVMKDLIASIRTRLRKLGVPDRFMPTLEDQLAGIEPRTHIDLDLAALIDRPPREIDEPSIRRVIEGKRVLITGAGGSIGSELARIAARFDPQQLLLVDRSENALFEIDRQIARRHPLLPRKPLLHDVVDARRTMELFEQHQPQVIFHAAAHKHVPMMEDHPGEAVDNNLFGTKSMADAAHAVRAERFVMISTDKAVNPSSIMGATKRLAELYVQHMNARSATGYSMVRFGNVLGSSGSVLDVWSRQIADGGPITVTDPAMTRYFMTIPEAAALVIQSAALLDETCSAGEVFVLDMGAPVRVLDVACRFIAMHGLTPGLPGADMAADFEHLVTGGTGIVPIVFVGARPGEKIFEELAYDAEAMRPTRHPAIHVWELPKPEPDQVAEILALLDPAARSRSAPAIARAIRRLVPEMTLAAAA